MPPPSPSTLPTASLRALEALSPAGLAWSWTQGQYDPSPRHLRHLSRLFATACMGAGPKRILVSEPPRHGKSWLGSLWLPTWFLHRWPQRRVMLGSYEADFAATWGRRVRNALTDAHERGLTECEVSGDSASANRWDTTTGGGMVTAGVGGPFTGKGADLLLIDDPVKNAEEADSETLREKAWEWWTTTAYTRLEPGAVAIVTMTRWHEDDLAGRIIANDGAGEWTVVRVPAVAEHGDPLGRKEGEALWPERYPREELDKIRAAIGSRAYGALYQGSPTSAEGNRIKRAWIRYYDTLPDHASLRWAQSWDATFKETEDGSFIVGQVWAWQPGIRFRYLVDEVRFRGDFVDTLDAIKRLTAKWPRATTRLIEEKANGAAILSSFKREGVGGLIPIAVDGKHGSKAARLDAVAPSYEAGDVLYPSPKACQWIDAHISEVCGFPTAPHNDRPDAASQFLSWVEKSALGAGIGTATIRRRESTSALPAGFASNSPF